MSRIKIDFDAVKDNNIILPQTIGELSQISNNICSVASSIDGDVYSENGTIKGRIQNSIHIIDDAKERISRLYTLIECSVDDYINTEYTINRNANDLI